ncbi:MAG: PA domain-containing protein [Saprospiraceae bacterium]
MRSTFTLFFFFAFVAFSWAQINDESPFPVDFEILAPSSIAGTYDYGTKVSNADNPIWGPQLSETLSGEVVWAYDATDSLGCEAIVTDLTGKFALIRRGTCGFVNKVFNAQEAGAIACIIVNHYADPAQTGATIVGMLGGDGTLSSQVTIPAVFIGRTTGEFITSELDAGNPVTVSFTVKSFYDPISSFSYHTPLTDALDFDNFEINYINANADEAVDVTVTATITAPSGTQTTLTGMSNVAPLADSVVAMDGTFLPTEMGEYTILWSNDQSTETLESKFVMTEFAYATDNGTLNLSAGPSDADFASTFNLTYQVGSLVLCDADGAQTSYASFGIANAADLFTGDIDADQVVVILYDGDANDDNSLDFAASGASFDDLTPVALGTYFINGNETPSDILYVELEDLADGDNIVDLKPNGAYYIVIAYDGSTAGTGIAPRFVASNDVAYLNFPTTPLFLDQLYTGWAGLIVSVRLYVNGFVQEVGAEDLPALDPAKVTIAPNPVSERMNLTFDLEQAADKVQVGIMDTNGKIVGNYSFQQVHKQNESVDMSQLPTGTYFITVVTPEGVRVDKVVKI